MKRKGVLKSVIKAVTKKGCVNCGSETITQRSSYCEPCFESLLKAKLRES